MIHPTAPFLADMLTADRRRHLLDEARKARRPVNGKPAAGRARFVARLAAAIRDAATTREGRKRPFWPQAHHA